MSKGTERRREKRSDLRYNKQSCISLALPKKRREPFTEIGNSLLALGAQQASLTGLTSLEDVPVRPLKQDIDEIDLPDLNNVRSGVQYVKDLYTFYDQQQVSTLSSITIFP